MQRREYTPTKVSQLTGLSNYKATDRTSYDRSHSKLPEQSRADYTRKSIGPNEIEIMKDYEALKMKVRQLQSENRQFSNDIQKLRYQKNINENKYMQKFSYEQDAISQFQKQKNYQLQLLKIKHDEDTNKLKRDFQFKLDDLQRQLRNRDYQNREFSQKNSYLDLKINQLCKGVQILEVEHAKFRQANAVIADHLNKQEFGKKKLISITEELEKQKCQMESQIHVLLDIQAEKSRAINTIEIQLKNAEGNERSLHDKLAGLTQNFSRLEQHIAVMKERLVSTDYRNQQIEQQLKSAEFQLSEKENSVMLQKEQESKLRRELQVHQGRELRRQKQIEELIVQNQRLVNEANRNRHKLDDISKAQALDF